MKRVKLYLTAALVFLMTGCKTVYPLDFVDTYRIDNKMSEDMFLYVEATPDAWTYISLGHIPSSMHITPSRTTTWIDRIPHIEPKLFASDSYTFTFQFKNGKKFTFSEELIPNDFRDENSWQVEHSEYSDYNIPHTIYTYTFTDEDYERIMELCEQPPM